MYRCMSCMYIQEPEKCMGYCTKCGRDSLMKEMIQKIDEERIVVGYKGKIGNAVYENFNATAGIEVNELHLPPSYKKNSVMIMHFCIPYTDKFQDVVETYTKEYAPDLVILHTTVPVGTTKKISKRIENPIVHVPINGHHTDSLMSPVSMIKDMHRYIMWVGAEDIDSGNVACDYINRFGFKSELYWSTTTEFAKIMSTNLIKAVIDSWGWHHAKAFERNDVQWNAVVRLIENIARNEPYGYLNRVFQRPGPIDTAISGKHCLSENSKLL